MKRKEYKIKVHSISRFIIALIIIFLSSITLINNNLPRPENEIISILQFLVVIAMSFYFAQFLGMGKVKILLTETGIVHIWERRFILSWGKNFKIPWGIVDNYVFEEDRTFDSFIINLTNKKRYRINRLNILPIKDDFKALVKDFPKLSNQFKDGLASDLKTKKIKEGESMYASKSVRRVFYFMSICFSILILTKIFNPDSGTTWSSLGVISSGLLFFWVMIMKHKKNN